MSDFIYPLATVVLDFLCAVICIKLMISRRSLMWVIPLVMSLALLFGAAVCLAAAVSVNLSAQNQRVGRYLSYFIFAASVVWTLTMIAFAAGSGKERRASIESRKTENEAQYIRKRAVINARATGFSKIKSLEAASVAKKKNLDLYDAGPVSTVRMKKTAD